MSGTNRTVMSDVVMKGGGESTMTSALSDSNAKAIAAEKKGKTSKGKK